MTSNDLTKQRRAERNEALRTLDIEYAKASASAEMLARYYLDDEFFLLSLHKARYDCLDIEDSLRLESGDWLRQRGYGGMYGPLLPPGQLPEAQQCLRRT